MGMIPIRHPSNLNDFFIMLSGLLQIDLINYDEQTQFQSNPAFETDNLYFTSYGFESNLQLESDPTVLAMHFFNILGMCLALLI